MKSLATQRRKPVAALVLVVLVLSLIGALYAAVGSATKVQAVDAPNSAEQIALGEKLFVQSCSSCHGIGGVGTDEAPSLVGAGEASADFQLSTGRMPLTAEQAQAQERTPVFSDEEIMAISKYVGSLGAGPSNPTASQLEYENADLALGGELFRTNCSQCHNFAGEGGALSNGKYAPNIRNASPLQIWQAMITGPENMPVFSDQTMSDSDKQAIIKFVNHLDNEPSFGGWDGGSLGPVSEGLTVFLLVIGLLIGAAVWIGAKVR